jgi:hypothetical protein
MTLPFWINLKMNKLFGMSFDSAKVIGLTCFLLLGLEQSRFIELQFDNGADNIYCPVKQRPKNLHLH